MFTEFEKYNTDRDDLCPFLKWKGQFVMSDDDPTLRSRVFWCLHTQTCVGPDGKVAEPVECASSERRCYGTGRA